MAPRTNQTKLGKPIQKGPTPAPKPSGTGQDPRQGTRPSPNIGLRQSPNP